VLNCRGAADAAAALICPGKVPRLKALASVWGQTKTMTRKEWRAAKRKWVAEKAWRNYNRQADAERLRRRELELHRKLYD
jgi:hypothetical protein